MAMRIDKTRVRGKFARKWFQLWKSIIIKLLMIEMETHS
jgi:hypothetical protein